MESSLLDICNCKFAQYVQFHFMSRWLGRWTCYQVQVLHLPLAGFVLGRPEFNSLAAWCKYPTDLTPASWDFLALNETSTLKSPVGTSQ